MQQAITQLQGDLRFLGIGEVLNLCAFGSKTGVLRLRFAQRELDVSLAFRQGRIGGISGKSVPRLSETLLKLETPSQHVGQVGLRLSNGATLADLQKEFPELRPKLEQALRKRVEMALLPVWNQQQGSFDFAPTEELRGLLEPGLAVDSLSLEIARRSDEMQRWSSYDPLQVYAVAERLGDFSHRIKQLMPTDWLLLTLLDGEQTLLQIGAQNVLAWDEMLASLRVLEAHGLIEPAQAQRGIQRRYSKLAVGQIAPAFTLPALDGSSFSLGSLRGKRSLLAFFRHGGCPWCNLRVHQLIQHYPKLKSQGVEVVGVFGSSVESLRERVGRQKPPFPLLADPDDSIHELYGTRRSLLGFMNPLAIPAWLEGLRLGIPHGSTDGETTRMPADFLLGPNLKLEQVLYGSNASEHIPLDEIERWAAGRS